MRCEEVFTPYSYPRYTYVQQSNKNLESKLDSALKNSGVIVSLLGPSKSGKTVLLQNVVDDDDVVVIQGSEIESDQSLWQELLKKLDSPSSIEKHEEEDIEVDAGTEAGGMLGIPSISRLWSKITGNIRHREGSGETKHYELKPFNQVINILRKKDMILFIDDFHYLSSEVQKGVTEALKEAARQEVSICIALVPHRSDDIIRGNPDLQGRILEIDIGYWDKNDLMEIGFKGFDKLRMDVLSRPIGKLSEEAAGSPQLMQLLCQGLCNEYMDMGGPGTYSPESYGDNLGIVDDVCEDAIRMINHSHTVDVIQTKVSIETNERDSYYVNDTEVNINNLILHAIAFDPPQRSFKLEEIHKRVDKICDGDPPNENKISEACKSMVNETRSSFPEEYVIDWDSTRLELDIPDPYFLFYLRWSSIQ